MVMDIIAGSYDLLLEYLTNPWIRGYLGLSLIGFIFISAMAAVWLERKISADIQFRIGPCRVGPIGIFQLIADAIKLFTKEDIVPRKADSVMFRSAPIFLMVSVFLMLVAIPIGAVVINGVAYPLVVTDMDISILYVEAVSSISIIGVFMVAYSSNNKYALLGAFRNFARMVGYEIPLGISIIAVAITTGSLNIIEIVENQTIWNVILQPIGFFVFFVALMGDLGRLPFDQTEAEQEVVAGWLTEYCGMRFGLGFFAEYIHMILGSFLVVLLFLGGWNLPGLGLLTSIPVIGFIIPTLVFLGKSAIVLAFIILLRWAVPRFRIDQVVNLGWKRIIPLSIVNLIWAIALGLFLGA
ncbi:F420H2 dehydrogenase subunit FpoH [Methanohalobium sp.]|uniref:F420H2 dehydrogenase subunit FpoH n=1 Tax=Methanohalobium sp. TaxID=2837493 RepID=UPI0025D3CECC|nr:F420H2 dehydrogenase subunit FpoH [Methanohalobium sp.]